ncbi:MAG: hypothetical protein AAGJ31_14155, partial [Verrucomicrobiota bacterium]
MILIWLIFLVSGFRNPTQPISLSDKNGGSAIRQLIFASTGMIAIAQLFFSQTMGNLIMLRWQIFGVGLLLLGSVLWSVQPTLTIKRSLIFLFGLVALTTLVHSCRFPTRFMFRSIIYVCGIAAILSILLHFGLPKHCTVNPARPGLAGITNHPNSLAPCLSIGLILSYGWTPISGREAMIRRVLQSGLAIAL